MKGDLSSILNGKLDYSLGAFVYGSSVFLKDITKANDIDVFVLCPGKNVHIRLVKKVFGMEVHEYRMSEDVIKNDILKKSFGELHACNFWGPLQILEDSTELNNLIELARTIKLKETLTYMNLMRREKFAIKEILSFLYFKDSLIKPYGFAIIPRLFLSNGRKQEVIDEWLKNYSELLKTAPLKRFLTKSGDTYSFKKRPRTSFVKLYSADHLASLRFWKTCLEIHNNNWNAVFKHASKHLKRISLITTFYHNISVGFSSDP